MKSPKPTGMDVQQLALWAFVALAALGAAVLMIASGRAAWSLAGWLL